AGLRPRIEPRRDREDHRCQERQREDSSLPRPAQAGPAAGEAGMSASECPREQETLAVVQAGRWPDGCDDAGRAHAEGCPVCSDIVRIAALVSADSQAGIRTAHVPNSGLIWWRMQRRARQEAVRTASRVITIVQAIAVAAGVSVAMGIIAATTR